MNKKTEAKCTGSMLTVGFHGANPPLIWRFDLERNHSFTLSLQGEEGDWELGVTSPRGDFHPVVHFSAREDAEEALMKVEKTLSRNKNPGSLILKVLMGLGIVAVIVVVAVVLFGTVILQHSSSLSTPVNPVTVLTPQSTPTTMPEGIPVTADDVLKAPH